MTITLNKHSHINEKLNITQPAVSQHIRFLEKHYNTRLFRYEGKKLRLTGAGEILRNASLTMMHDELSMQNEMTRADGEREIRFGATRTVGDTLMGGILEKYLREYPDADIHMVVENTRELLERLDDGRIDFAAERYLSGSQETGHDNAGFLQ